MTDEPKMILNELLTYVCQHMSSYPADNIKTVLIQFYSNEEISEAKALLWKIFGEHLGKLPKRIDKGQKSASAKDIDDLLKAVRTVDGKPTEPNLTSITFVAKDLRRLPNIVPGETDSLSTVERLNRLEHQMRLLQVPDDVEKPSYASVAKSANSCSLGKDSVEDISLCGHPSGLTVKLPPIIPDDVLKPGNDTTEPGWQLISHKQRKPVAHNSRPTADRPKKPKAVYGTRQSTILCSAPQRHDIFVFRVHQDISDESLGDFLRDENVNVVGIERVSKDIAWTKSYRVTIETMDLTTVLRPEFWPDGIGCRRFFRKHVTQQQDGSNTNRRTFERHYTEL